MTRNHGSVTAFVVTVTSSLMLLVGLVHGGGRLVAAHLRVSDLAAAAARAGAQQVVGIRAGHLEVDPAAAVAASRSSLRALGTDGSVEVGATTVTVTVRERVTFAVLTLVGLSGRDVAATRVAMVVRP